MNGQAEPRSHGPARKDGSARLGLSSPTDDCGPARRLLCPVRTAAPVTVRPGAAGRQADPLGDPATVVGVGLSEVAHHPLLDVPWAALQRPDEVLDQLVTLVRLEGPVAVPGLGEVVRPADLLPHQAGLVPGRVRLARRGRLL